jgi:AcrR family transcriptional regulator
MGRQQRTPNGRLSVDDWVQAGFAILAEEGIKALKVDRLSRRFSVTKGSFYWHFTDIATYRAALAQAWGELRDEDRRPFGDLTDLPPRERLSRMMSSLVSPGTGRWMKRDVEGSAVTWCSTTTPVANSRQPSHWVCRCHGPQWCKRTPMATTNYATASRPPFKSTWQTR